MAQLTPVDYDPFAQQQGPRLVPVDGDPFAEAPAAPQRGMLEEYVTRPLGQAARYTLEGLGGTVGVFSDPLAYMTGGMPARDLASLAADKMGLPKPEGALEEVVASGSRALAGGAPILRAGQMLTQAPGITGGVARAVADAPVLQATSAITGGTAAETARQMGASPGVQFAAGLAGALGPSAAAGLTRAATRGGEQGRQRMLTVIDEFEQAGAGTPTVAQATEGRIARGAEGLLTRAPGGAGIMARAGEAQQAGMGARVRAVADSLSTRASPEQAGRGIREGVVGPGGFMSQFRNQASKLYNEVDNFVPPDTLIPVSRTKATLDALASPTPGAEATSRVIASGKIADIRNALDTDLQASIAAAGRGELPYQAMKQLRSRLGELIADSTFATDAPTKQLKQIYGAISDDMTAAVTATNNPAALRAVTRANNFYKAGMKRMEVLEQVVERAGGGEQIFAAATSGSREGATKLRGVMQSLPKDAQRQLAAAVIRRLGRANPSAQDELGEAFSSESFLSGWNRLAPEAKSTLFGRFGPSYVRDLDVIARSAANIREGSRAFANPSGTAQAGTQIATSGAFIFSAATGNLPAAGYIAGGVGLSNLMARAMTSPTVVKWLAQQTAVPVAGLPAQVARLKAEAYAKGDTEALEFAAEVERLASENTGNDRR